MGIIGTLRDHSGWVVGFVGLAIVAFIVGDLTRQRGGVPDMGRVNGTVMSSQRFNELVDNAENNYRMQYQTSQIPADAEQQIREQVWQNFVEETLMEEQMSKLGLTVGTAELSDMYTGRFIHPYVRQNFTDPQTGQFNMAQVRQIVDRFDEMDTTLRVQWVQLEKAAKADREAQKYSTLLTSGFYMPKAIVDMVAKYSSNTANVRVVALPFASVSDEEVTINDADYKNYYEKHQAEFRVPEEFRELEFVTFPVVPTQQDYANIQQEVMKVWDDFTKIGDDEMRFFVNAESDAKQSYDTLYHHANEYKAPFDELIANAGEGTMLQPVVSGNEWMMGKVERVAMRPDSLRVSAVYIYSEKVGGSITRTNEQAKQLADSVLALVSTNKMSFEDAVMQFSDEQQKADTKGDTDWQLDGAFGPMNEQVVNTAVGKCFLYEYPNNYGYAVVKVTDKTKMNKKYRVAVVTRNIVPSNATNKARYSEASQFAGNNRTISALEDAARQQNLQVRSARVGKMQSNLAGVNNARSIVQWAYDKKTKVGEVAPTVYECEDQIVVVGLNDVYAEKATEAQVRPMIEQPVRLQKKGELLEAKATEAVRAGKDINSIALKLNVAVDTLDSISFNDYYFGRYGMEPKVQSAVASSESGLVGPVKGASGVYVLQVDGKAKAEANDQAVRNRMEQPYRNKARMATQVLRNNAKIVDQRNSFF